MSKQRTTAHSDYSASSSSWLQRNWLSAVLFAALLLTTAWYEWVRIPAIQSQSSRSFSSVSESSKADTEFQRRLHAKPPKKSNLGN